MPQVADRASMQDPHLEIEQVVADWCHKQSDILAAIVIGSRGRSAGEADTYSDLDLILFCLQPARYSQTSEWLKEFGNVWIATLNTISSGDREWMVYFAPGLKADFLLVAAEPNQTLSGMLDSLPYPEVLARGYRILYRSESSGAEPVPAASRSVAGALPDENDFQLQVNTALFTAERFVKFSIRRDSWRSRYTFEAELKRHLLVLIEWHALIGQATADDIWYEGRNMANWADERVAAAAHQLDAGHSLAEEQTALLAFLKLLESVAGETAVGLGYDFPTTGQQSMIDWLKDTMARAVG